jgi:hypothetical protein
MAVAVDKAAVVHYALLPRGVGTGWGNMSAADVQLASQGMGWSAWEVGGKSQQNSRRVCACAEAVPLAQLGARRCRSLLCQEAST